MTIKDSIDRLLEDRKGKIFLAQLSRAVAQAERAFPPDRTETLRKFIVDCLDAVRDGPLPQQDSGGLDPRAAFYLPIVVPNQDQYFHLDPAELSPDGRLVTLVSLKVLTEDLLPLGKLQGTANDADLGIAVAGLTGEDFQPDARVGAGWRLPTNICWASRFDDVVRVAPSLRKRRSVLPFVEADRLRNYLGLGHYGENTQFVVLMFKANALRAHKEAPGEKVTRPFIFEGVGNHRFTLFDRDGRAGPRGWNHALDLARLEESEGGPKGGCEIVMTSISCREIERCMMSERLGVSPCEKDGADERILDVMLWDEAQARSETLDAAVRRIERFVGGGAAGNEGGEART
ncbi:hypothetical protein SAMN05421759_102146 [Roseivivax lentus]|uniref:Uncharacterized protein n=1 Tax=Roseivivax lentus TaxID=633194 RepID=A0A1N7KXF5_9RHOB|nr:hypothetical protein [Roseivivax lentus]SIS66090.1 hypothetical protein SAMN05421759_102146 [Roseivivax lentus]